MTDPAPTKHYLFIINDAPYGNERPYNALRLALSLSKRPGISIQIFLTADGVFCARKGQKTPDGYYNLERMMKALLKHGTVATCGTCCEARGLESGDKIEGILDGNMDIQTDWAAAADQILVY